VGLDDLFTTSPPLSPSPSKERGIVSKEALLYCLYKNEQTSYTRFGGVTWKRQNILLKE